jgi:hypothetical protein
MIGYLVTQLTNINTLVFVVLGLITFIMSVLLAPKYNLHLLRRMPQVDAMIEACGVAAEKGTPLMWTPGQISSGFGVVGRDIPSVAKVTKYVATECAKLDVPFIVTVSDPMVHQMMVDYTRAGYIEAGYPERYNEDIIYWVPTGWSYAIVISTIGLIERENCSAVIQWGMYGWCTHVPILEVAVRRGAFLIAGENWSGEAAVCSMFTDYVGVCEELTAAGVYVSGDPVQGATLFGEDLVKIGLMIFMIVYTILFNSGIVGAI